MYEQKVKSLKQIIFGQKTQMMTLNTKIIGLQTELKKLEDANLQLHMNEGLGLGKEK